MKLDVFLLVFLLTILNACAVVKTKTAKTMDIYGGGVIQIPVVVDLDVDEQKVKATATSESGESLENVKNQAIVTALKNANADVLVEPTFETEIKTGKVTATVTGYPAVYKNFRPIKEADIELVRAGVIHKAEVYEPEQQKKRKGVGIFVAFLIGISAVVGVLGVLLN